jgi:mannosyl-oligosaccharide alpha-1,2-mannosidase
MGSLTLEFTRLSQLIGNPKYYDAVQRITNELERGQSKTKIPGLWPLFVNAKDLTFDWSQYSLGGSADSTYEYLPKEHILLGAQTDQYRSMYENAIEAIKKKLLFRAMTKDEDKQILFTSNVRGLKGGALHGVQYIQDHLKCFLGGTVGIASKIFNRTEDLPIARGLTDGCIWAYDSMPTGIMPETLEVSPCAEIEKCPWDEGKWYEDVLGQPIHSREHLERAQKQVEDEGLPPGIVGIADPTYKLRYDLDSTFPVHVPIWSVILTTSLGPRLSSPSS